VSDEQMRGELADGGDRAKKRRLPEPGDLAGFDRSGDGEPDGGFTEPVEAAIQLETQAGRRSPCPNCGSRSIASIMYGYPMPGVFDEPEVGAGEHVLGGCCIWPEMPMFRCHACGYEWAPPA
jgi:hypothetical protein